MHWLKSKRRLKKKRREHESVPSFFLFIVYITTGVISLKRNTDNSPNNYVTANETNEVHETTAPIIVSTEAVKTETETKQTRCAEDYDAYKNQQSETKEKYLLKVSTNSVNLYDSYGKESAYPQKGDFLLTDGIAYENLMRVSWRNNNGEFVTGWADFNRDPEAPLTETKGYYVLVQ